MIQIQSGSFQECVDLSSQIPEFDSPYVLDEYEKRCAGSHLLLNAFVDEKPVGFKVGYDRFKDGSFYSWMGGVLPKYRRQKVADALADKQENWTKERGYTSIRLKTRKKHQAMLEFCIQRGFIIIEEISKIPESESWIWLEKQL